MPSHPSASPVSPLWAGRIRRAAIPPTRDPFINAMMTRLTPDASGAERFFISTYIDTDGRNVYYSCSRDYGKLGSILTRYDMHTGLATYASYPLGDQQITSLFYDRASDSLICGSTIHADCESCPPTADTALFARIDAQTLQVVDRCEAPRGSAHAYVWGSMGQGKWLASLGHPREGGKWFVLPQSALATPTEADLRCWPAEQIGLITYAGQPGMFLLNAGKLEVWDMGQGKCLRVLPTGSNPIYRVVVQDQSVICCSNTEVLVLADALDGI